MRWVAIDFGMRSWGAIVRGRGSLLLKNKHFCYLIQSPQMRKNSWPSYMFSSVLQDRTRTSFLSRVRCRFFLVRFGCVKNPRSPSAAVRVEGDLIGVSHDIPQIHVMALVGGVIPRFRQVPQQERKGNFPHEAVDRLEKSVSQERVVAKFLVQLVDNFFDLLAGTAPIQFFHRTRMRNLFAWP